MRRAARSLEDCLMADAGLARLSTHARRLLRLQRVFAATTPLARQSRIANAKLGKVVIYAANSAVAAKLRQMEPRLIKALNSDTLEVTLIEIRVQPASEIRPPDMKSTPEIIGEKQKQGLTSLAESMPEGSSLREALKRLVAKSRA